MVHFDAISVVNIYALVFAVGVCRVFTSFFLWLYETHYPLESKSNFWIPKTKIYFGIFNKTNDNAYFSSPEHEKLMNSNGHEIQHVQSRNWMEHSGAAQAWTLRIEQNTADIELSNYEVALLCFESGCLFFDGNLISRIRRWSIVAREVFEKKKITHDE